jgi:hypothetical protein
MVYKSLQIGSDRSAEQTGSGALRGVDNKTEPQFLTLSSALNSVNYIPLSKGRIVKRQGRTNVASVSNTSYVYELAKLGDHDILGYGTNVAAFYRPTSTLTVLKNDFPATGRFSAFKNGDYVYVTKGEGIYQIRYARGLELVSAGGWGINNTTMTDGEVAQFAPTSSTHISPLSYSGGDFATLNITAAVGDQYEFNVQMENYNTVDSVHTFHSAHIYGAFDPYYFEKSQNLQSFVLTATAADDLKLNQFISYATNVVNFYTPSGVINGSNKVFTISNYTQNLEVTVDSSPATNWVLEGLTLTVDVAPTAAIQVKHTLNVPDILDTAISIKKIIPSALEISLFSSERAKGIATENGRMYAFNYPGDPSRVEYSSTGLNNSVPSINFSHGVLNNNGGDISVRTNGEARGVMSLGSVVKIFYSNGEVGTAITLGETNKKDEIYYSKQTTGLAGGLTETPFGIIVPTTKGIWLKTTGVASDIAYSDNEEKISDSINDFTNYDFSDAAGIYYQPYNATLIACRYSSNINNRVLAYFHDYKAWGYFIGWNVNSFVVDNGELYAGSAIEGKTYKLFDGLADGSNDIWTDFYQEVPCGALNTSKRMLKQWFSGRLSQSSSIRITFDIYDRNGNFIPNKKALVWTVGASGGLNGIGDSSIRSAIGGDTDPIRPINSFVGAAEEIADFQRLRIRFTENSKVSHEITWFTLQTYEKDEITNRGLSNNPLPESNALLTEAGEPILTENNETIII